jgi:hypothetical protein
VPWPGEVFFLREALGMDFGSFWRGRQAVLGFELRPLVLARQELFCLNHIPSLFCFVLVIFLIGPAVGCSPPTHASHVACITGIRR